MFRLTFLLPLLFAGRAFSQAATTAAQRFGLSTSTSLPFPQATLDTNSTQSYIASKWGLSKGRIQNGGSNLAFVNDPFPDGAPPGDSGGFNASGAPVLQVQYPAGSFQDNDAGGAQFYAMWNSTSGTPFQSMMVTYEVAFDTDFDWVKGGKLPGLRGGPDPNNCSGGNQANGTNCFSSRVMWRTEGNGEGKLASSHVELPTARSHAVYTKYMPTFQRSMASATTLEYSAMTNLVSAWTVVLSASLADSTQAIFFLHLVAVFDPRSKLESRYHAGQVKRRRHSQWTGDTLVSASSQSIFPAFVDAHAVPSGSFNDGPASQHDNIVFRQTDAITTGGLYFS